MKDIKAILGENGVEGDVAAKIEAEVRENYKTKAEWSKKVERIADLEKANADLADKAAKVEGSGEEIEALKAQVESYKAAEDKRKADEAEAERRGRFRESFDKALGEREFVNDMTADSVFEKAYALCSSDAGKGAEDAIEEAVKGSENVWANPQKTASMMPKPGDLSSRKDSEDQQRKSLASLLFS